MSEPAPTVNIRNLIDSTLIPHKAFLRAKGSIEQCFAYAADATEPSCIAIPGESRTGKSRSLEEVCSDHPTHRTEEGLIVPIVRVKAPSKPTVKSLAGLLLKTLGDPHYEQGTENARTIRLQALMRNTHTRMVMIDEFQHFYDRSKHLVMHHVADWLKVLVDDARLSLVVAGLPSCMAVIDQNEQLAGRFLAPIHMPRFDWKQDEDREEFVEILAAFHAALADHFDLPDLSSSEMAFRCYCATGGLMGYLTKFLRQALRDALDAKRRVMTLADLMRAQGSAVWSRESAVGVKNPFSSGFVPVPTEDLLAKIARVGTPVVPEPMPRRRASRKVAPATVGSLFA